MGRHSPLAMANGSRECLSDYPPKARPRPSEFRVSHNLRRVCRRGDVYLLWAEIPQPRLALYVAFPTMVVSRSANATVVRLCS